MPNYYTAVPPEMPGDGKKRFSPPDSSGKTGGKGAMPKQKIPPAEFIMLDQKEKNSRKTVNVNPQPAKQAAPSKQQTGLSRHGEHK